ncbi:MAG: 1-acyl-sn-glycerol-3-phosphate acyltransferase [Chloroflexota bacterium]|nr:1-acyl-sn-glycerol-3-phosphate acyltransferase [Chloroflexota bacterium]
MNQVELLTGILALEGAEALGWERGRPGGSAARRLLRSAARRIAREFVACDEVFASRALPDAARWCLDRFSATFEIAGLDRVPRRGPILLVANHPGLTDAVGLIAALDRPDVRIVAADFPFLHAMRGLGPRLIFLGASRTSQLSWIRAVARDLREGGVVLLFPAGRLEPDPAVLGRDGALMAWSDSVALIARLAPDAQIVPAAVTGVLSARAFAHPLTRIRRTPRDRQRVATLLQMIDPRYRLVTARIAFGAPLVVDRSASDDTGAAALLAARMRDLLSHPSPAWKPLARRPSDPATTTAA